MTAPRQHVGVVLDGEREYTGSLGQRARQEVGRIGRVAREDDRIVGRRAEEASHGLSCSFVRGRCHLGLPARAAMHAAVPLRHLGHRIGDLDEGRGAGREVQVDLAPRPTGDERDVEILPDEVEARAGRQLGGHAGR